MTTPRTSRVDAVQQRVDDVRRRLHSLQTTVTASSMLSNNDDDNNNTSEYGSGDEPQIVSTTNYGNTTTTNSSRSASRISLSTATGGNNNNNSNNLPMSTILPNTPNARLLSLKQQHRRRSDEEGKQLFEPVTVSSTFEEVRQRLNTLKWNGNTAIGKMSASEQHHQQHSISPSPVIPSGAAVNDENNITNNGSGFQSIQDRISAIATRLHDVASKTSSSSENNNSSRSPSARFYQEQQQQQVEQEQEEEEENQYPLGAVEAKNNNIPRSNNNRRSSPSVSSSQNQNKTLQRNKSSSSSSQQNRESSSSVGRREGSVGSTSGGVTPIITSQKLVSGMFSHSPSLSSKKDHHNSKRSTSEIFASRMSSRRDNNNKNIERGENLNDKNNTNNEEEENKNYLFENENLPSSIAGGPQSIRTDPSAKSSLRFAGNDETFRSRSSSSSSGEKNNKSSSSLQATLISGAELFAILRLRGLVSTHGSSGEHLLPSTAVHKMLLTPAEISQLVELRKSLQIQQQQKQKVSNNSNNNNKQSSAAAALPLKEKAEWRSSFPSNGKMLDDNNNVNGNNNQNANVAPASAGVRWK